MEPGVRFLHERIRLPRPLSSLILLLSILLTCIGLFILIITEVSDGIVYVAEILPAELHKLSLMVETLFQQTILPMYERVFQFFHTMTAGELEFIREDMTGWFQQLAIQIGGYFQNLLFAIPGHLAFIPESVTVLFFILIASFLLSADFPRVKYFIKNQIPIPVFKKLQHLFYHTKKSTFGYIKAECTLILITCSIIFTGFLIIEVEHALTLALFMAIIDLIPFVGTGLLFIPWIGYSFLSGNYVLTIGLSVIYGIVILTRQLIEPKVYSMNLAIHPLAWLFTAFIGMKLWGVFGLILAPFTLIFFKGVHEAGVFQWMLNYIHGKS
jgi:sporulation integral membrane protein YtvI